MRALRLRLLLALLLALPAARAVAVPPPGWDRIHVAATGQYFDRYVPTSLDSSAPSPAIVFLHGYGGTPGPYRPFLEPGAEATGAVVIAPRSDGVTWGIGDDPLTISEALRLVSDELALDSSRIAISGHSAGGAYAYLLAYLTVSRFSSVFTLAASYYPVGGVADASYTAPIRMYYGGDDPNYVNAYPELVAQWTRLGVPFESQIAPGYPHCCWPESALVAGFEFLVAQSYPASSCVAGPTRACLAGGRFAVEVDWRTPDGASGKGTLAPAGSVNAGVFWFFTPDNWEMLVKVLDGCAVNGRYWVFAAATTNVDFELRVTDTASGAEWRHTNAAGPAAPPVQDTAALPCTP